MPFDTSSIVSYIGAKLNDIKVQKEDTEKYINYLSNHNKVCSEKLIRYNACLAALIVIKENKDIPADVKEGIYNLINNLKFDLDYDTNFGHQKYYIDRMGIANQQKSDYISLTQWLIDLQDAIT